jgi:hypothetical protein
VEDEAEDIVADYEVINDVTLDSHKLGRRVEQGLGDDLDIPHRRFRCLTPGFGGRPGWICSARIVSISTNTWIRMSTSLIGPPGCL